MEKLLWINQQWIMKLDVSDLSARALPFFEKEGVVIDDSNRDVYICIQLCNSEPKHSYNSFKMQIFFVSESEFSFVAEDAQKLSERNQNGFLR